MTLFSERQGYKTISTKENYKNISERLKNRLWNYIKEVFNYIGQNISQNHCLKLLIAIWSNLWGNITDDLGHWSSHGIASGTYGYDPNFIISNHINDTFFKLKWHEVYDLLEFILKFIKNEIPNRNDWGESFLLNYKSFSDGINQILEQENAPYRFINGSITPITNEIEINEIAEAINKPKDKYESVTISINKALTHFSNRKEPDYENSIKESITAIESLTQIITGKDKTLSALYQLLGSKLKLHPTFSQALKELYDWTCDEKIVRHGTRKMPLKCLKAEAKFMLVICSAFVNYLIEKFEIENTCRDTMHRVPTNG